MTMTHHQAFRKLKRYARELEAFGEREGSTKGTVFVGFEIPGHVDSNVGAGFFDAMTALEVGPKRAKTLAKKSRKKQRRRRSSEKSTGDSTLQPQGNASGSSSEGPSESGGLEK